MPVDLYQDPDFANSGQQQVAATGGPINLYQDPDFAGTNAQNMTAQPTGLGAYIRSGLNAVGQGGADVLSGVAKAGMGLANTPHNIVNLFSPQLAAHIPTSPINSGDINQIFGTQNPSLYGKFLQGVGQFGPFALGGEALGATGVAGDVATGAAYGGTQSQNPLTGALKGGALNAALGLVPGAMNLVGQGINYLKPQDYADQIVGQLSGGRSLEDNAKSLAQDVQNSFENQVNLGKAQYQPVFNAVGNQKMYEGMQPENSAYQSLDSDIPDSYDRGLKKLHQNFISDPTFQNAHLLQSQLGSTIRTAQSKNLSLSDQATVKDWQNAQNSLQSDMSNFLNSKNPDLANQYQAATQNWAQNVVPYIENPKISAIATGDITNPANIASIFKNPEPEVQKVASDLGDDANNKILYSMLGKTNAIKSPENLVNAFKNLDQQGLNSYVPQTLQQQIASLGSRIKARNAAQMVAGGIAGLGAVRPLSEFLPTSMLEPAAMGGGAMLGKSVGNALQKVMPSGNLGLSNALLQLYPALRSGVIPNVVGGQ